MKPGGFYGTFALLLAGKHLSFPPMHDRIPDYISRDIKGAFHFFAHRREVVKYKEKRAGERREHESQEEYTAAESGRCNR
jgi:hypothetical protein